MDEVVVVDVVMDSEIGIAIFSNNTTNNNTNNAIIRRDSGGRGDYGRRFVDNGRGDFGGRGRGGRYVIIIVRLSLSSLMLFY